MNTQPPSKPRTKSQKHPITGTSKRYSSLRESDPIQRYQINKAEFSTPNNSSNKISVETTFDKIERESVHTASRIINSQVSAKEGQKPSPIYSKIQLGIASLKQQRSISKTKNGENLSVKKKHKRALGTLSSKNLHSRSFLSPTGKSVTPKASSSSKMKKRNIFASNPRLYQDINNKQKRKIDLPKRICSTLNARARKASKTPTRRNPKKSTKELLKKYGRGTDSANISIISTSKLGQGSQARLTPTISTFNLSNKNVVQGKQEKLELEKKNYELLNQIKALQYAPLYTPNPFRKQLLHYRNKFDTITAYLQDNTYIFENNHQNEFGLECVQLIINENRSLRDQLDGQGQHIGSLENELRKVRHLNQYYPERKDTIIFEDEDAQQKEKGSSSSRLTKSIVSVDTDSSNQGEEEEEEDNFDLGRMSLDNQSIKTQKNSLKKPKDASSESDLLRSSNLLDNNLNNLISYLKSQSVKEEVRSYIEYILGLVKNDSTIKQIQLETAEKKAQDNMQQARKLNKRAGDFKKKYKKCKSKHRVLLDKLNQFEASLTQKKSENEQTAKIFRNIVANDYSTVPIYSLKLEQSF